MVAAWDPDWPDTEPVPNQRGWLTRLAREIDAAMTGHQMAVPGGHVYHVVLSVPKVDGALGDRTWRELVEEAIVRMGFGPDAEGRGGCRWVAVHHGPSKEGNDHVHLVVNLVRGDGRIADTYRDWPRWRTWCLEVERRLGLTPTSPADKTAPRRPTRAETEKAARVGLPTTSREYLRERRAALEQAAEAVIHARDALVAGTRNGESHPHDVADGVAHATLDLMVATAKVVDVHDRGPIATAALVYERAAATPYRVQPSRWAPLAAELRMAARQLSRVGARSRSDRTGEAVVALIVALAALVVEVAAWREQNRQRQQAAAARRAAALLNEDANAHQTRVEAGERVRPAVAQKQGRPPTSDDRPSLPLPGQRSRPSVGQSLPGVRNSQSRSR